jgi:hypothetical protein
MRARMNIVRDRLRSAWMGIALAGLFFYPLASVLHGNIYYLQWQPAHSGEALVGFALVAAICGVAVHAAARLNGLPGALALTAVAALPLASFAAAMVAQLRLRGSLVPLWEHEAVRLTVPAIVAFTVGGALVLWPGAMRRLMQALVAILSPVAIVVLLPLLSAAARVPAVVSVDRPASPTKAGSGSCDSVVALLFDELSFAYLYEGGEIRHEFPAIRRMSERATHHLAVAAPARETLVALPAFLAARSVAGIEIQGDAVMETSNGSSVPFDARAPDGLFATAKRLGFRTEMGGYYFAYCDLLGPLIDSCQSFSFYNASSVNPAFSPVDAIETTLILWPRQFPFGLIKNPAFGRQQRQLVDETLPMALRPLSGSQRPVFRLIHFSVPHLPFVFDRDGYHPPRDPLRTTPDEAYVKQLAYVDQLVDRFARTLDRDIGGRDVTVVLLADHGFRFGGRETDPLHIPFIVRRAPQKTRRDVTVPERGETLLRQVVMEACAPAPPPS